MPLSLLSRSPERQDPEWFPCQERECPHPGDTAIQALATADTAADTAAESLDPFHQLEIVDAGGGLRIPFGRNRARCKLLQRFFMPKRMVRDCFGCWEHNEGKKPDDSWIGRGEAL
jgi:hypothetical protein